MSLFSCSGTRPANLGINDGRLRDCPSSPNCVSSDADDSAHSIAAFELVISPTDAWRALRAILESLPRMKIIAASEDYIHAECSSAFFGFVDDLELHLRAAQNLIAVRSASRLGQSDFGVNRKRVEHLRATMIKQRVLR
ncbi:MAG: DUF1499 domain-containing protein [Deltaproteobacteria bacterium]|nr:DUF1499 domain-containing protein [Deltaproteobacteria bacterium]